MKFNSLRIFCRDGSGSPSKLKTSASSLNGVLYRKQQSFRRTCSIFMYIEGFRIFRREEEKKEMK